ncbi:MAG TPA: GNAT family N-acetyltransferase [Candidatus Limnocylindrales bacterium]|nr:GNAT family N-acetyltransferase [Candidatus Limnocylindrales bacterium]
MTDEPAELEVRPATADRWPDVELLLGGDGPDRGCWCQPWRGLARRPGEPRLTRPELLRSEMLRSERADGPPPPGFVAYLDGVPVGWCGVSVRGATPRLDHSRVIPAIDDRPVWAIGCFRIRVGYRRRGVARVLLGAVIAAARAAGAPGVEAYPVDPEGHRIDTGFAYVGIASMFDAAGFRRVRLTDAHSAGLPRWLVRLDINRPGERPAPGD